MRPAPPVDILYVQLAMALERGQPIDEGLARSIAKDLIERRTNVESFAPTAAFLPPIFRWAFYVTLSGTVLLLAFLTFSAGMFALATLLVIAGAMTLVHVAKGGRLIMSIRRGWTPPNRPVFEATALETVDLAEAAGLDAIFSDISESIQEVNRANGVKWLRLVFEKTA